ncbi:MAG: hypothetical protein JKY18_07780 [Flavobacteriales bacterium]|nr:hypothetical protein [Flavobacteriales bacterium]
MSKEVLVIFANVGASGAVTGSGHVQENVQVGGSDTCAELSPAQLALLAMAARSTAADPVEVEQSYFELSICTRAIAVFPSTKPEGNAEV